MTDPMHATPKHFRRAKWLKVNGDRWESMCSVKEANTPKGFVQTIDVLGRDVDIAVNKYGVYMWHDGELHAFYPIPEWNFDDLVPILSGTNLDILQSIGHIYQLDTK